MIPDTLAELQVDTAELTPYDDNPRQGDVGAICVSLEANGQYRPIVVNRRDMTILAGNHTFHAARQLGWETIAATFVDVDESTARRIVLVDNRSNDLASYDDQVLADLLTLIAEEEGPDGLVGTGFDGDDLDQLLDDLDRERVPEGLTDPDDAPEAPDEPVTKLGDVWLLGDHRLVCGDSTLTETYGALMGDEKAAMVFTDPPYGISYRDTGAGTWDEKKKKLKEAGLLKPRFEAIEGDDLRGDELLSFLAAVFFELVEVTTGAAAWYVWHASRTQTIFEQALSVAGYEIRAQIVWAKSRPAFNFAQYKYQHEPCFYAFRQGQAPGWYGDNSQTTLWQVNSESGSSYVHPTQKPVNLAEIGISNSSQRGEPILDPFGGSGSTLIAAHRTGRVARLVELDPAYCDVICRRYQEHTGTMPVLESTGEPHDFADTAEAA